MARVVHNRAKYWRPVSTIAEVDKELQFTFDVVELLAAAIDTHIHAAPDLADLDGNGTVEVIGGLYAIFILNGADGSVVESIDTPGSQVWPGVLAADLEGDGDLEIVTARGGM